MHPRRITAYSENPLYSVAALILTLFALSTHISYAEDCTVGSVPISTAADRAYATAVGVPSHVQCWDPNDPKIGRAAGATKQWLRQHALTTANISCLNNDFAERLKKLMESTPGGPPTIVDGYRSPQKQANLPAGSTRAGPCESYHQYGQAADFNNASAQTQLWMRRNAATVGLAPVSRCAVETGRACDGGFSDPGHIQIAGPKTGQCGICSSTGAGAQGRIPAPATMTPHIEDTQRGTFSCPGGYALFNNQCVLTQQNTQCPQGALMISGQCVPFSQNQNNMPPPSMPGQGSQPSQQSGAQSSGSGTPTGGTPPQSGSTARSLQDSPWSTQGSAGSSTPQNTLTGSTASQCTPQYMCQGGTMYYQTNSCTLQMYQVCTYGCAGSVCALSSNSASTSSTSASTYSSSSFLDQLNQILNPVSKTTPDSSSTIIGTILNTLSGNNIMSSQDTPTTLNQNIAATSYINGDTGTTSLTGITSSEFSSVTSATEDATVANQTFAPDNTSRFTDSDDLLSSQSILQRLLADIQLALAGILNYLHFFTPTR